MDPRPEPRPRRLRSVLARGTAVLTVATLVATTFVGANIALIWSDDPLSHWRSAEAQAEFNRLHAEALETLPLHRAKDVSTSYGTVRAHRAERADPTAGSGDLAPIVLLPGTMASSAMWADTMSRLSRERPVIALDAIGQPGRSTQTRPIRSAVDQAAWLDEALAALGVDHAHVVGVSLGGWLAANLVRHRPDRVASLSLIEPVYVFGPAKGCFLAGGILSSFPLVPEAFGRWYADWIAGGGSDRAPTAAAAAMEQARRHFTIVTPPPEQFTEADLSDIDVGVYAVLAGRSVAHDAERAMVGSGAVRQLELDVEPEASHAVHAELGERLDQRILDFVARHEPR